MPDQPPAGIHPDRVLELAGWLDGKIAEMNAIRAADGRPAVGLRRDRLATIARMIEAHTARFARECEAAS